MKSSPSAPLLGSLMLLAGCSTSPDSMSEAQYLRLFRFQIALGETAKTEEAELFAPHKLGVLPDGIHLTTLDLHGTTGIGGRQDGDQLEPLVFVYTEESGLRGVPVTGRPAVPDPWSPSPWCLAAEGATPFLAGGGSLLGDFDRIDAVSEVREDGVTFVGSRFGRQVVAFGGEVREGTFFDDSKPLALSPDGLWVAFHGAGDVPSGARIGPARRVEAASILPLAGRVVGDVVLRGGEEGGWSAHAVRDDGTHQLVVDGVQVGSFEAIGAPVRGFGGAVAWPVETAGTAHYVIDSEAGPAFDAVRLGSFSLDGHAFAHVAAQDGQDHVVVDGSPVASFPADSVEAVAVGENGVWSAVVRDRDGWLAVQRGEPDQAPRELGRFGAVAELRVVGGRAVFVASVDGAKYLHIDDDRTSGPWDWIGGRAVDPSGKLLAFVAGRGRDVYRDVLPLD